MSLHPNYCECDTCEHGIKICSDCRECQAEHERQEQQKRHEASVRRQQAQLRRPKLLEPK